MNAPGYNPMRWKCEALGCFNVVARPKVELFADCFPGKCSLGDIDYEEELNGFHLRMEWKQFATQIPPGQRIAFDSLISIPNLKFTVLCVAGDAHRMTVTHAMHYTGRNSVWIARDFGWVRTFLARWALWAMKQERWAA
jgi:hypothetical protein